MEKQILTIIILQLFCSSVWSTAQPTLAGRCNSLPCQNAGDCVEQGFPLCICAPGFYGQYCEEEEEEGVPSIQYPGDLVGKDNLTGTVIRVVNETYHTPPVLVVWRIVVNSTESWETRWQYDEDIDLLMESAVKDEVGPFECRATYLSNISQYETYMMDTLKVGMLVRYAEDTAGAWKGDTCVKVNDVNLDTSQARLWCYRQQNTHVQTNLTLLQIMGVNNYPAQYEYVDVDNIIVGLYQYPVVSHANIALNYSLLPLGESNSATLTVECGNGLPLEIAVNHDKKDYNSYQVLSDGVILNGHFNFTTTWNATATGTYYIEFRVADSEDFWHFIGAWYNVIGPVLHDFEIVNPVGEDRRFVYTNSSVTSRQLTNDTLGVFMAFIYNNINVFSNGTNTSTFSMMYTERGVNYAFSIAWNGLNLEIIMITVLSVKKFPVQHLTLVGDVPVAKTYEEVNFTFNTLTGRGSTCVIYFGDGTYQEYLQDYTTILNSLSNDTDLNITARTDPGLHQNFTKTYNEPGVYNVSIICNNDSTTVANTIITIEKPISRLIVNDIPGFHVFGQAIQLVWSMEEGTDVTFKVLYNTVRCCPVNVHTDIGSSCDCLITNEKLFYPDLPVTITVKATNQVSKDMKSISVNVHMALVVTGLNALPTMSQSSNIEQTQFAAEYPIRLNASYTGSGLIMIVWMVTCTTSVGNPYEICRKSSGNFSDCGLENDQPGVINYQYQPVVDATISTWPAQTCAVVLTIFNEVSEANLTIHVEFLQSINYTSMSNNGPRKSNVPIEIKINLSRLGTDTCLVIDLGDHSPLRVYATWQHCERDVLKTHPNSQMIITTSTASTSLIVFNHTYNTVGTYQVKMSAKNSVSMATDVMEVAILDIHCEYPVVAIEGVAANITNTLHAAKVCKTTEIVLTTQTVIDCEIELTHTKWTVRKLDDDPRLVHSPDDVHKTLYQLPDSVLLNTSKLIIPKKTLLYGFYEITTVVHMDGLPRVFGEKNIYVQIVPTPWLEAEVVSAPIVEEYYGNQAVINASISLDPDFDGVEGHNGMTFQWFCKDTDDDVTFDYINEPLQYVPHINDTFTPADVNSTGCFGTGRGRLNSTDMILRLETMFMVEGKYFALTLLVSKYHPDSGLRTATRHFFFHVLLGYPPTLDMSCTTNCLSKVNQDEKIIINSQCTKYCYGEMAFLWKLYLYDDEDQVEPLNLTSLNEVPEDQLRNMVTNPTNELGLAFRPFSLKPRTKYVLQVTATRPNKVVGEKRYTLKVNKQPENGTCVISPSSGIALKTLFNITCINWMDADLPLSYEYSYSSTDAKVLLESKKDVSSELVALFTEMPIGNTLKNNSLVVYVEIIDRFEGKKSLNFTIQVSPPNTDDMDTIYLQELIAGENGQLKQKMQSGDVKGVLRLASIVGSVLNNIGQDAASINSTEIAADIDVEEIDQMKQSMLSTLSKIEVNDMSTLSQMSGTVQVLTSNPQDLSEGTQDVALDILDKTVNKLGNLTKGTGFQSAKSTVTSLTACIAQLVTTTSATTIHNRTKKPSETRTMQAVSMVTKLHDVILQFLVANEGATTVETEYLTLQTEKVSIMGLGQTENEASKCHFKVPSATIFGLGDIVEDRNATISQLGSVVIKVATYTKNPFTWDNTSKTVTSKVASLELDFGNGRGNFSDLTKDIAITVARDPSQFPATSSFYMKPDKVENPEEMSPDKRYLKYHCVNRTSNWTSINFELHPEDVGLPMKVYLKTGGKPDLETKDYDRIWELPNFSWCNLNTSSDDVNLNTPSDHVEDNETIVVDPYKHCQVHPYRVFLSNKDLNTTGEHCFAVQTLLNQTNDEPNDEDKPKSRKKRSFACDVGKRRMRRSCVIIPPPPPPPPTKSPIKILSADNLGFDGEFFFPNQTPNYNLTVYESSCLYWDEGNKTWTGHGCWVGPLTSRDTIQCFCNHLTSFGSDLLVAPNPIDFDSVFNNFGSLSNNVAVLALISTILGIYILGVIWARRADKRDMLMTGPTILRNPQGSYRYLITLHTGNRVQSGTTAKVFFKMSGDHCETLPVKLWDRDRPCFQRTQENSFVVGYPQPIGDVAYVQIWHNNTGTSPSWYLSRLSVKDLQTNQQWYFVCDNWLAVESDDGKVCRLLPVANDEELTNFNQLFTTRTVKGLADGHLWFSIFSRPPNSNFTRVQRLSCCLCLLCCTMITSAMFYNMGGEGPSPFTINIGSLAIDLKGFVIGLQSSIIIIPVNIALVQIFRNLRPKKKKEEEKDDNKFEGIKDEQAAVDDMKGDTPPPQGKFPYWFLYVAYFICYITSAACIFFTLLYSIQWGQTVSTEWVIAMVTAFLQSVLLLQPIKVVFMAIVFAVIIRKPCDSDDEPAEEVEYEAAPVKKRRIMKPKKTKMYSPPDPESLLQARIKRLKEIKMNAILAEIATFFVFLGFLMNVANYHRHPDTYLLTKTLFETFDEVDAFGVDFGAVEDGDSLWMWARETLVPNLYATEWYNGKKVKKGYISNMEDYLVGVPRIRLIRIEQDSCKVERKYFKDTIPHCYSSYSIPDEETGAYGVGWIPLNNGSSRKRRSIEEPGNEKDWLSLMSAGNNEKTVRRKRALDPIMSEDSGRNRRKKKRLLSSSNPKTYTINDNALLPNGQVLSCLERWRHQSTLDLRGFPYWGSMALYSGGGYAANLGYDPITAYTVISDLHSNGWLDVQTRAVLIEFTVYNANTNLFGMVSMFVEFPASSGAFVTAQYQSSRFYLQLNFTQTLSHVMVIFFMLYFLYREGRLMHQQRCAYLKGFWNWIETILIISEFATIILFLARLYEVDRNLIQLQENPNDYVGFQYAGSADAALCYVLGLLVFFYNIRFLRLLRFNNTFLILGKTIARIAMPVFSFCIPFFFGFLAFGLFAFSVFGSELEDYSTFVMTMVTQFSMTLGDFDFESLVMVNPIIGPIYFFAFTALNVFILMNVFLAIINDTYGEIQDEEQETENEYEVIDYVVEKLHKMIQGNSKKTKVTPKKPKPKLEPRYMTLKKQKRKKLFSSIDDCEAKLSNLIDITDQCEKAIVAVPEEKRNDQFYRALLLMEAMEVLEEENDSKDNGEKNGNEEES